MNTLAASPCFAVSMAHKLNKKCLDKQARLLWSSLISFLVMTRKGPTWPKEQPLGCQTYKANSSSMICSFSLTSWDSSTSYAKVAILLRLQRIEGCPKDRDVWGVSLTMGYVRNTQYKYKQGFTIELNFWWFGSWKYLFSLGCFIAIPPLLFQPRTAPDLLSLDSSIPSRQTSQRHWKPNFSCGARHKGAIGCAFGS